jgi:serine/threonine protein kinase/SAM-dependent methyltransferase
MALDDGSLETEPYERQHAAADTFTEGEICGNQYRILSLLGRGGMGEVWEAEQLEPLRRMVALKVIKWGMDTQQVVARFESERQTLALMSHSNIARVLDAGATEQGRPYFVMELVHGVPITEHCDRQCLDIRDRLKLFLQVCAGVQYAHQKGVIHRDLKPANILVAIEGGRPVPKIIDFGIAKATTPELTEGSVLTRSDQLLGTPEYMSPEQANMDALSIDIRTDIYSLGAVLYEVLTGLPPFDASALRRAGLDEMRRRIRTEEPVRPSTRVSHLSDTAAETANSRQAEPGRLVRALSGDLDWITMKALEKEPDRRYAAVTELAADLRSYLEDRPVGASRPSAVYRLVKFVRRRATGVGLISLVTALLIVFVVAASIIHHKDRQIQDLVNHMTPQQQAVILSRMHVRGDEMAQIESFVGEFESADREAVQKPVEVLAALGLRPGEHVADIGSGTGYFTVPVAKLVGPSGRVWAVEIDEVKLDFLRQRLETEGLENVIPTLVSGDDHGLPAAGVDTILLVNTYRCLENRREYARKLRTALAPEGRVVVIDAKPGSQQQTFPGDCGPSGGVLASRIEVDADLASAGLVPVRAHTFLPEQYFVEYIVD